MKRRQTRLTPAEGGRFADPVGPSPELVAEIRALHPMEEMNRYCAAEHEREKRECVGMLRHAVKAWGKDPAPGTYDVRCFSEPGAPTWTPKVGDWVRGPDGVVGQVTASMTYYGHKSISIVHVGDRRSTTHRTKRCEPWTPRVGERVRSRDRTDVDQFGCIGVVTSVDEHLVDVRCDDKVGWQTWLEYIEPAP